MKYNNEVSNNMKKEKWYKVICSVCAALFAFCSVTPITANAEENRPVISYETRDKVEQSLLDYIEEHKNVTPSVSIVVFDSKQDICSVVYGETNTSQHIKADENTVYEWGSVSKLLIWTSAMQLYEQGKLDLNEDIRVYLPDGFLKNLSFEKPVTMIDLMNHSGGFQESVWDIETDNLDELMPLDEAITKTAPAQTYAPGETVSYSNWSASLAGYIVECVSGMDYADYVNENIFEPLGMEHTYMKPDASDNEWAAEQRKKINSYAYFGEDVQDLGECRRYIHLYPAGSAGGTISDMAVFAKAFLCDSKDCPLFMKDETLDEMLSPSCYFSDNTTPRLCHGLFFSDCGNGLYGHGGNTEGFSADLELDLENKTGFVSMTNKQSDRVYSDELCSLLYGEYTVPSDPDFEKIDLSGYYEMGRSAGGVGVLRILSPYEDILKIWEQDGKFTGNLGVVEYRQISDSAVEMKLITGTTKTILIRRDENGNFTGFQSFQAIDYVKESNAQYYTDIVMIALFAASLVIMPLLFIVHIIRLRKFKEQPEYRFKRLEMFSNLSVLCITVELILIAVFFHSFFGSSRLNYAVVCIALCIFSVLAVFFIVKCWLSNEKPKNKIIPVIETMCVLFIAANVFYWPLFQFWGF